MCDCVTILPSCALILQEDGPQGSLMYGPGGPGGDGDCGSLA